MMFTRANLFSNSSSVDANQECDEKLAFIRSHYDTILENSALSLYHTLVHKVKTYIENRAAPGQSLGEDLTQRLDYVNDLFSKIAAGDREAIQATLENEAIDQFKKTWALGSQRLYDILVEERWNLRELPVPQASGDRREENSFHTGCA